MTRDVLGCANYKTLEKNSYSFEVPLGYLRSRDGSAEQSFSKLHCRPTRRKAKADTIELLFAIWEQKRARRCCPTNASRQGRASSRTFQAMDRHLAKNFG
jgi:hypothetical protein